MTTPQTPDDTRRQFITAAIWTVIAAVITIGILIYAMQPELEKRDFYYVAAAIAAIAAAANGYAAWQNWRRWKGTA